VRKVLVVLIVLGAMPAARGATTVAFRCDGNGGIAAMENSYVGGCWGHLGHHTYDLDGLHRVGAVSGSVFSVEEQFSPPTEGFVVLVEGSADGLAWTQLHAMPYVATSERQSIAFSFDGAGFEARFVRIRQPRSAAQGLSGYLDASRFDAELSPVDATPATAAHELSCERDVMERFFDAHPCWFGGIDRYDAPSVFHTYPLGADRPLARVAGEVTFLPWRLDDYSSGSSRTQIAGFVQVSADGVRWTDAGRIEGSYGTPIAFDLDTAGTTARFVRLVGEHHARFASDPALKHTRGMVLSSRLSLT
jgi:hypothetical protein